MKHLSLDLAIKIVLAATVLLIAYTAYQFNLHPNF